MGRHFVFSILVISLSLCVGVETVFAQRKSALEEKIDSFVYNLDQRCPIDYTNGLTLVNVSAEHEARTLHYVFNCDTFDEKYKAFASGYAISTYNTLHSDNAFRFFDYTQRFLFYNSNGKICGTVYIDFSSYPKANSATISQTKGSTQGGSNVKSNNHVCFMGIPVTGEVYEFISKISGFDVGKRLGNRIPLQGDFMDKGFCNIDVLFTPISHTAYCVVVSVDRTNWDQAKKEYTDLKKSLTKQYGKPYEVIEEFRPPYKEGKSSAYDAFDDGKVTWQSRYSVPGGEILLKIDCDDILFHVEIWHMDYDNNRLFNSEQKEYTSSIPSNERSASQSLNNQGSVLPTTKEIEETNARLPVLVSEGTMWTKLEYDRNTKIERFYYRFTEDIDPSLITSSSIKQGKERMKNALRQNKNSMARINAGMTYLYIYSSKDNKKLYEIRINKRDF